MILEKDKEYILYSEKTKEVKVKVLEVSETEVCLHFIENNLRVSYELDTLPFKILKS